MQALPPIASSVKRDVERYLFGPLARKMPLRITPYHWPDIDGIAGTFALQELLKAKGYPHPTGMIAQTPQREAAWILEKFDVTFSSVENWMASGNNTEDVILIDCSDHKDLPPGFPMEQVKVVIDHRSYPDLSRMPSAIPWIELVGSAATLVGELYKSQAVKPNPVCAHLLYAAIMSNTIELTSRNTTQQDRAMVDDLRSAVNLDHGIIDEMFRFKSDLSHQTLYDRIDEDLSTKTYPFGPFATAVAQLEIIGVETLLQERTDELKMALEELRRNRGADRIILVGVDIGSKKTFVYCEDPELNQMISTKFPLKDCGRYSYMDHVMIRKDLIASFINNKNDSKRS